MNNGFQNHGELRFWKRMYFIKDLVYRISAFILPQIALVFKSQQKLFGHPDLDQNRVGPHFWGNCISDFLEFEVPKVGQV